MRHCKTAKRLGRTKEHRIALRRNLIGSILIKNDMRVKTTLAKAKFIKPHLEKIISLGREKTLHNYRRALSILQNKAAVARLFGEIGPSFAKSGRPGGYSRILKLATRRLGDGGKQAFVEIIKEGADEAAPKKKRKLSLKRKPK